MTTLLMPDRSPFRPKPQLSEMAWVGWFRAGRRGRWRPVVGAFAKRDCWKRLLNYRDKGGAVECERTVLASGERPP